MQTPPSDTDWSTLARYVAGECSASEREAIGRWASADPANRALLNSIAAGWNAAESPPEHVDVDAAWARMAARLSEPREAAHDAAADAGLEAARDVSKPPAQVHPPIRTTSAPPRPWWRNPRRLAAAVVVAAAGLVIWRVRATTRSDQDAAAMRTESTAAGERRVVQLGDSSTVMLSVSSSIRIPWNYGGKARDIYLDGEAFFRVRHDRRKPFRVHAGASITEDIGTDFAVRAYSGSRAVQVIVSTGAVSLQRERPTASDATVRLSAGDVADLPATGPARVRHVADVAHLLGWTRGTLVFDDAPLSEVAAEIGRWYDVDVRLADPSLASRHLSVEFSGQDLAEVMRVVSLAVGATFERRGDTVIVTPRPGAPTPETIKKGDKSGGTEKAGGRRKRE